MYRIEGSRFRLDDRSNRSRLVTMQRSSSSDKRSTPSRGGGTDASCILLLISSSRPRAQAKNEIEIVRVVILWCSPSWSNSVGHPPPPLWTACDRATIKGLSPCRRSNLIRFFPFPPPPHAIDEMIDNRIDRNSKANEILSISSSGKQVVNNRQQSNADKNGGRPL